MRLLPRLFHLTRTLRTQASEQYLIRTCDAWRKRYDAPLPPGFADDPAVGGFDGALDVHFLPERVVGTVTLARPLPGADLVALAETLESAVLANGEEPVIELTVLVAEGAMATGADRDGGHGLFGRHLRWGDDPETRRIVEVTAAADEALVETLDGAFGDADGVDATGDDLDVGTTARVDLGGAAPRVDGASRAANGPAVAALPVRAVHAQRGRRTPASERWELWLCDARHPGDRVGAGAPPSRDELFALGAESRLGELHLHLGGASCDGTLVLERPVTAPELHRLLSALRVDLLRSVFGRDGVSLGVHEPFAPGGPQHRLCDLTNGAEILFLP